MVYDVSIIGGGIVGLATALAITKRFPDKRVCLLEKESTVAAHQTGHNSGVIHSGLYYKPGSAKAKNCVEGARRMVEFCREHNIPHEVCGKVVVATHEAELPALAELLRRGQANGVPGVEEIGPERLREIEPHAAGIRALRVPSTGIIDYTAVAKKIAALIVQAGGEIRLNAPVTRVETKNGETVLHMPGGEVQTRFIVNCAGLHCDRVARLSGAAPGLKIVPFRGEFYKLVPKRQSLVKHLIYPVPDPRFPFLGVHFTRLIGGGAEAGPNAVLAFKREGYKWSDIDARDLWDTFTYPGFWRMAAKYWYTGFGEMHRSLHKAAFVKALQNLIPEIRAADLQTGGTGVRAQALEPSGALVDDFRIVKTERAVHVLNAPSPAATSSLCIGEQVAGMIEQISSR